VTRKNESNITYAVTIAKHSIDWSAVPVDTFAIRNALHLNLKTQYPCISSYECWCWLFQSIMWSSIFKVGFYLYRYRWDPNGTGRILHTLNLHFQEVAMVYQYTLVQLPYQIWVLIFPYCPTLLLYVSLPSHDSLTVRSDVQKNFLDLRLESHV